MNDYIVGMWNRDNNERELKKLFEELYPKVFGFFYKRLNCREDIEDFTSITLNSFFESITNKNKMISKPEIYIWRIAHNQLTNFIRYKSRQPVKIVFDENWIPNESDLIEYYSDSFQAKKANLIECINNHLKPNESTIVRLLILENRKSIEVAEILNIKAANIRKILSRTIFKLRASCLEIWNTYN